MFSGNSKPTVTVATKVNRRWSEFWCSHGEVKSLDDNQDWIKLLSQSNVDNMFLQIPCAFQAFGQHVWG